MNMINVPLRSCILMLTLSLGHPFYQEAHAQRAASGPPDWPCVQRLIPELAWGTLWPGPSLDDLEQSWWEDEEIGRGVRQATSQTVDNEQALGYVRTLVNEIGNDDQRLTLLFSGVFEQINNQRSRVIESIRSASRAQVARLEQINELVNELETTRDTDTAQHSEIAQLEEQLHWQRRIFQRRQQALPALCEKPYLLEEQLARMVRLIRAEM